MRILGIDPGSQITGFGLIQQRGRHQEYVVSGCIRLGQYQWSDRLKHIFEGIVTVIEQYQPQMVAIEQVFVHKNASSALKLGQARGAAMVAAASLNLPIAEYSAKQVKRAVVGYGNAEKRQIQQMIKGLFSLGAVPQKDAADALAVAVCHGQSLTGLCR